MRVEPTHHSFTVRVPVDLLKWIDRYTLIKSLDKEIRMTRNSVINSFLEQMREIIELQEKHQWDGKTHIEVIQTIMEDIAAKQSAERRDGQ